MACFASHNIVALVRVRVRCRVRLKKRKSAKATESITHCPQQYTVMNQCNKAASQRCNRSLFVQQSLVNTGIHYKASQTPQHGRYLQHLPSQMQAQTVHHLAIPTAICRLVSTAVTVVLTA